MSSQRRPPQGAPGRPGAPAGKPGAAGGKPGAPERKSNVAAGPVITPQVLGIALAIILIVAGVVYYQSVYVKSRDELASLKSKIASSETNIQTYKKKIAKLPDATDVNIALREKLGTLDYLFLSDQSSLIPFFETELFPIVDSSRMSMTIEAEVYTFEINMAMSPFTTLPSHLIEDANKVFKMKYFGEQGGTAPKGPRDTRPGAFIKPYSIRFLDVTGTYEDVQKFIEDLQQNNHIKLLTVHCVKNDKGDNVRFYRTASSWTIETTVYFMNPEQAAVGDDPPGLPGSKTCK